MSCLYILEIMPCIVCKYFLPLCRLSFHFVVSFAMQKLVSLIRSHLFIFVLISITLGDWPKKILLQFINSSRSFIVLCLIFKSLSYFEFIFICMIRGHVLTSLIYMGLSSFPSTTWTDCLFLNAYSWLCWRLLDHVWVYFGLSILFHWYICLFLCQYHTVLIL